MKFLRVVAVVSGCVCWLWGLAACSSPPSSSAAPPTLPPQYYNCIEANPLELLNVYFGTLFYYYSAGLVAKGNEDLEIAEATYDNQYFVFKHLIVADWMVAELDQGWIYAGSGIKCILVNPKDMRKYKPGDYIDVVGLNTGITAIDPPGILFKDCYVLPAGAIDLPLSGAPSLAPAHITVF